MSLTDILLRELAGIIELSAPQLGALSAHYELLIRWNRKMNLTTLTDLPDAATRHYCESLFLASRLTAGSVVDVGSGAGFPGIPVAIARPDCAVDLVEAHQRKAVFLREAAREFRNVQVISGRAEGLQQTGDALPRKYDWLISRAVDLAAIRKLILADRCALLVGADDARDLAGVKIPLPWGERRVLVVGPCST